MRIDTVNYWSIVSNNYRIIVRHLSRIRSISSFYTMLSWKIILHTVTFNFTRHYWLVLLGVEFSVQCNEIHDHVVFSLTSHCHRVDTSMTQIIWSYYNRFYKMDFDCFHNTWLQNPQRETKSGNKLCLEVELQNVVQRVQLYFVYI